MTFFVYALEIIGTVAFAISGAMVGMKKRMDIFGVCILGLVTACGGGAIRDVLLGKLPPVMFRDSSYGATAIIASIIVLLPIVQRAISREQKIYDQLMLVADSAGLGVFTAVGKAAAIDAGFGSNYLFCIFLGAVTGVGGGALRDVLAGNPPYIFVKHIYACASILGAILYVALEQPLGKTAAMLICVVAVFITRLLAAHFRWSLPKANLQYLTKKNNSKKKNFRKPFKKRP